MNALFSSDANLIITTGDGAYRFVSAVLSVEPVDTQPTVHTVQAEKALQLALQVRDVSA